MFFPDIPVGSFNTYRFAASIRSIFKFRPVIVISHKCGPPLPERCHYETRYELLYDINQPFGEVNKQFIRTELEEGRKEVCY